MRRLLGTLVHCGIILLVASMICSLSWGASDANSTVQSAKQMIASGNYDKALAALAPLLRTQQTGNDAGFAEAYDLAILCYEELDDTKKAWSTFTVMRSRYPQADSTITAMTCILSYESDVNTFFKMANVCCKQKDKRIASVMAAKIINHAGQLGFTRVATSVYIQYLAKYGKSELAMPVLYDYAIAMSLAHDNEKSYQLLQELFNTYPQANQIPHYLNQFGYTATYLGEPAEGLRAFDRILSVKHDESEEFEALIGKACALRDMGEATAARASLEKAEALARELGDQNYLQHVFSLFQDMRMQDKESR